MERGGMGRDIPPYPADINLFICKWAVEFRRGIRIVFAPHKYLCAFCLAERKIVEWRNGAK